MRLWGGRFAGESDERMAAFTRSIEIDAALALDDIEGSIAHVRALRRAGLVTAGDEERLVAGLADLRAEVEAGALAWDPTLEDVHLNLEAALAERIGPVAGRLHTGRSRNDQVATDLRLWLRRAVVRLDAALLDMEDALVTVAERHPDAVLPGATHIQPAQPVLLAHHLLAYVEMLERDRGRFADAWRRADRSPLGSGAIAGAGYPLDREASARELGLAGPTANSMDATSDRDFVVEAIAAAALAMVHLSRLAEEIAWWSNPRFGFVRLADAFSTGSSMMPNKKNPDPAELVRGRTGRVIGDLAGSLAMLKGLPLAYQRDLQEDKPALFDALGTLEASLGVMAGLVASLSVDESRMRAAAAEGHTTATAVADAIVRLGVPFRTAHHVVGRLVAEADRRGSTLADLPDDAYAGALGADADPTAAELALRPSIGAELRAAAGIDAALASCDVVGGTAPVRVAAALVSARERIEAERATAGRAPGSRATAEEPTFEKPPSGQPTSG
ncbi:MAG: argininosuccinate lyase [Chloroflexi bacterium]|jgi:argininosuccinate lyase|nr:argininosuccinate lyase [Chloroflexota bacterium]